MTDQSYDQNFLEKILIQTTTKMSINLICNYVSVFCLRNSVLINLQQKYYLLASPLQC